MKHICQKIISKKGSVPAASSSVILNSVIPRRNAGNRAVSRTSQLSSKAREEKVKTSHSTSELKFEILRDVLHPSCHRSPGQRDFLKCFFFSPDILAPQSPRSTLPQTPPPKMAYSFQLFVRYHEAGLGCCIPGCV